MELLLQGRVVLVNLKKQIGILNEPNIVFDRGGIFYANHPCQRFEGALAEQFVGQELIASSPVFKETKLFYWMREAKNSNAEIDYLLQKGNEIYPLEVKAGKTGTLKSMQVFLGITGKQKGIRFNLDLPNQGTHLQATIRANGENKIIDYSLLSLPMYFAGLIGELEF